MVKNKKTHKRSMANLPNIGSGSFVYLVCNYSNSMKTITTILMKAIVIATLLTIAMYAIHILLNSIYGKINNSSFDQARIALK